MKIPGFFKTYRPRQFNYSPLYYDKRKDELEERIRKIETEYGAEHMDVKVGITRGSMRRGHVDRVRANRASTIKVLIIAAILMLIAYYLIYK